MYLLQLLCLYPVAILGAAPWLISKQNTNSSVQSLQGESDKWGASDFQAKQPAL